MRKSTAVGSFLLLIPCVVSVGLCTTWLNVEIKCPICGALNDFFKINSCGGYIYEWNSKYQYLFWPYTEKYVVYMCRCCRYAAFMSDFEDIERDLIPKIRYVASRITISPETSGRYNEIPMTTRLLAAERIYLLRNRDAEFWSHFYRTLAYHLDAEGSSKQADDARRMALEYIGKILADLGKAGSRKEALLISGAMKCFLNDLKAAVADFESALNLTYSNSNLEEKEVKKIDEYLSTLLTDYLKKIRAGENIRKLIGR